ncbi:hypothetical protein NUU61_003437 [Penicillium alfredii]|uniref:Membrane anchor Opy2 N-terminal domain-containing protein n=1 Tax=Penicillium alfredii TaxID=1506179 RepID=A0A9W9FTG0_9EURO|nr:uncharacterized protein NUU61_003437 [Penicillium alfredii]KAJ5106090.1 hypothetical protein NUU61_003437 [Penicillium alfredii]
MLLQPIDPSSLSPITGISPGSLFRRNCKQCPGAPTCPSCPDGSTCQMTSQTCDECSTTKCVKTSSSNSDNQDSDSGGSNAGAIAGGVIGGVVAIAIIVFLIWWFVIRKKRQGGSADAEKTSAFDAARSERKSTNSIASTVLTRASNVIQIAYIPGVTNRSPPETPATLVPPVPPLPGATPDQHFFMPGDLRDSAWTNNTHQSMSPTLRSSVATTVYRNNAIVSELPAQQIQRSRAAVVSIHNGPGSNSPTQPAPVAITPADAPAVPAITSTQLAKADALQAPNSSIVARSVTAKPVMVRGPSLKKKKNRLSTPAVDPIEERSENLSRAVSTTSSNQFNHTTSTFDGSSSDEEDDARPPNPRRSPDATSDPGPFDDRAAPGGTSSALSHQRHSSVGHRHRHSASSSHNGRVPARVQSPFSDANEVP